MNKTTRILLATLLAAIMIPVMTPGAEAQGPTDTVCTNAVKPSLDGSLSIGNNIIRPIVGLETVNVEYTYKADAQGTSITSVPVLFEAKADKSWLTVTLEKSQAFVAINQNGPTDAPAKTTLSVSVSKDAPAFEKATITVTATAGGGACLPPVSTPVPAQTTVQADFYENYQARFDQAIWKTGQNARIQVPMTLENFGNGALRVQFAVAEGTSEKLNLALPGPQVVDSTIAGGDTNKLNIPIDVQTPFKNGYENRRDNLLIDITGASAFDTSKKVTPLQLSGVIQTQGVYVPGFEAVTLLGAAIALAFMSRRRL